MNKNYVITLLALSLLIVGSVIFTNYLSFKNIEDSFLDQIVNNQVIRNEHSAREMEIYIETLQNDLTTLSQFPSISECTDNSKQIIQRTINRTNNIFVLVDNQGDVIEECSDEDYVGFNFENTPYFSQPRDDKEVYISNLISRGTNKEIIISAPILETTLGTEVFGGVIITIVDVDTLYNLFIHPFIDGYYALINLDTNSTILISEELENVNLRFDFSKESHIRDINEERILATHWDMTIGNERWRLIYVTPLETINEGLLSIQRRHIFSLIFVLSILLGIFAYIRSLYISKEDIQKKLDKANVTLEKLGINIETETSEKYTSSDISLSPKKIYLIQDENENTAHEAFISGLNEGYAGLGLIRQNPESLKEKYNLKKTSFIKLAKGESGESDIETISKIIEEFILKSKKSIVLIDRIDYLMLENGHEKVIRKIQELKDVVEKHDSIIILGANPSGVESTHLDMIKADTQDIFETELNLTDTELEILRTVNDSNIKNKLVSYKDISSKFNITKPTTRSKINMLSQKGLLTIEQRGRYKSLKITSKGRKII